jgi:hypothetical protein
MFQLSVSQGRGPPLRRLLVKCDLTGCDPLQRGKCLWHGAFLRSHWIAKMEFLSHDGTAQHVAWLDAGGDMLGEEFRL